MLGSKKSEIEIRVRKFKDFKTFINFFCAGLTSAPNQGTRFPLPTFATRPTPIPTTSTTTSATTTVTRTSMASTMGG